MALSWFPVIGTYDKLLLNLEVVPWKIYILGTCRVCVLRITRLAGSVLCRLTTVWINEPFCSKLRHDLTRCGRFDRARLGKPNPADTEPRRSSTPRISRPGAPSWMSCGADDPQERPRPSSEIRLVLCTALMLPVAILAGCTLPMPFGSLASQPPAASETEADMDASNARLAAQSGTHVDASGYTHVTEGNSTITYPPDSDPPRNLLSDLSVLPAYDVNGRCGSFSSSVQQRACLSSEQDSYDTLKATWASTSIKTRQSCLSARGIYGYWTYFYSRILNCITAHYPTDRLERQGPFEP